MGRDVDFFRGVTLAICGDLDVDVALAAAFDRVRLDVPVEAMGLGHAEDAEIRVVAEASLPDLKPPWGSRIPLPPMLVAEVEQLRGANSGITAVNDPTGLSHPMWLEVFPWLRDGSALFLDLGSGGAGLGMLVLYGRGQNRFSDDDIGLLESIRSPFAIAMSNARRYRKLEQAQERLLERHEELKQEIRRSSSADTIVGADFGLRDVIKLVQRVAGASAPVLILGETGVGKEVIARAIHTASPRNTGPFVALQCGAVPDTLLDAELFGYERGAFTGAAKRKRGRFERADGGTLFLDEIGELSADAQVKLLRVLQERRFERLGGSDTVEVDVRVVAATHRDLPAMVADGRFREDLWYRLNVVPIHIPPLRHRKVDIPSLVHHFIREKSKALNRVQPPRLSNAALDQLVDYRWPGNIRELQNVIERALILCEDELRFPSLGSAAARRVSVTSPSASNDRSLDTAMAAHIRHVLDEVGWQIGGKGGGAEILKINPSTLRSRMKKLGIQQDP